MPPYRCHVCAKPTDPCRMACVHCTEPLPWTQDTTDQTNRSIKGDL